MKPKINRETTIGLSVLAALVVILGVVVVRRFMRPNLPPEAIAAREEARREEEHAEHRAKREADSLPKPDLLTPVAEAKRDGVRELDDPGHWNTAAKEQRREAATGAAASSLIAADPPPTAGPPVSAEPGRREGERAMTRDPRDAHPDAGGDRYALAAAPSAEGRTRDRSGSMVIQVSDGESADGAPRPMDRYSPAPQAPAVAPPPSRFDGPAADAEIARRHAEKARAHGFEAAGPPVDPEAARSAYRAAPTPPSTYDLAPQAPAGNPPPTYPGAATDDAASNYSAVPGGEAPGRLRTQNRLRDDGLYEVQPNDSYWTISERVYGSGAYFRALAEQNRGKAARPDRLPPGLVISTPPLAQLEKDYPDLCPRANRRETVRNRAAVSLASTAGGGRTYVVQEGDTLSSIARNELGKVSRWAEIYQLNREALGKDYDYLTPGLRLVLPMRDSQAGDRTTRRGDEGSPLVR